MRFRNLSVGLVGLALVVGACGTGASASPSGSGGAGAAAGKGAGLDIEVVTHGQSSDPFWSIFVNGVHQAAADTGATVNYNAPSGTTFDVNQMGQLIDAAVGKKPAGLVVSIPDATALGPHITKAVQAGIPVISANSGSDVYQSLGILTHVGQDEEIAGQKAGALMKDAGVTNAICVNQEVGNAGLDARCKGFADGLGGKSTVLGVELSDQSGAQQKIAAALQADPSINGVMALGPTGAAPALAAIKQLNLSSDKVKLATFDLSQDVLDAIKSGTILFAVDQQQWLQGYLPVVFLVYYHLYGLLPGGGQPILTGPGIVDKTNVDTVIANTGTTR
ncbi:MAG TPA: sugar ABC transporter substrate-binding protein [Candidatus Limnocylindrales bacterium]|nr:sugar ABC transporter substrate-binding protein [Candidatus Limnocylindrales bacterium]